MHTIRLAALATVLAALCAGCLPTKRAHFDIVARNIGTVDLERVRIEFPGLDFSFGALPPSVGGGARFSGYVGAFPTHAKVFWRPSGPAYMPDLSDVVAMPQTRPELAKGRDQEYELLFELDGQHATANYVVNDYTESNQYKRDSERYKDQIKAYDEQIRENH